jgi:hypothetical protein
MAERVGKETSGEIHQNLLSPDRVLHTTQGLVYRRSQMTNLLLSDASASPFFIERFNDRNGLVTTVNCPQSALRVHRPSFASSWRAFLEHIFGDFLRNLDRLIRRGNLTLHVAHNQPHQISTRLYIEVRLERDPRTA